MVVGMGELRTWVGDVFEDVHCLRIDGGNVDSGTEGGSSRKTRDEGKLIIEESGGKPSGTKEDTRLGVVDG